MNRFREKAQGFTKQTIGQMIGDDALVQEGREQQQKADRQTDLDDPNDGPDRSSGRHEQRDQEPNSPEDGR
jgi:uncharacterized protein YjbJ (UPF0337 family)